MGRIFQKTILFNLEQSESLPEETLPMPRPEINKEVFATAAAVGMVNRGFDKKETPESIAEENKEVVLVPVPTKKRPKTPEPKISPQLDSGSIPQK